MANNPPISLDQNQNEAINQINTLNSQQDTRLTAVETINMEQSTAINELQSNIQAIGAQLPDGVVPLITVDNNSIDSLLM